MIIMHAVFTLCTRQPRQPRLPETYSSTLSQKKAPTLKQCSWKIIIRIDFDDIWQKYSKYSRIQFECISFRVDLLFYQRFPLLIYHKIYDKQGKSVLTAACDTKVGPSVW